MTQEDIIKELDIVLRKCKQEYADALQRRANAEDEQVRSAFGILCSVCDGVSFDLTELITKIKQQ